MKLFKTKLEWYLAVMELSNAEFTRLTLKPNRKPAIDKSQVGRFLSGDAKPDLGSIGAMARATGILMDWWYEDALRISDADLRPHVSHSMSTATKRLLLKAARERPTARRGKESPASAD